MRHRSVLVLNQNYEPINVCNARRAVKLIFKNKAEVIEDSPYIMSSATLNFTVPSVIRLYQFIRRPHMRVTFNRRNVLRRDGYTCQYCGDKPGISNLTIDHIIPRSKGGRHTWHNVVAACKRCNNVKANQTPRQANMPLLRKPKDPSIYPAMLLRWHTTVTPTNWKTYFFID